MTGRSKVLVAVCAVVTAAGAAVVAAVVDAARNWNTDLWDQL